jgi:hypothetical protein
MLSFIDGVGFAHLSSQGQEIIKTVVNMASHNYPGIDLRDLWLASVYHVTGAYTRSSVLWCQCDLSRLTFLWYVLRCIIVSGPFMATVLTWEQLYHVILDLTTSRC